MRKIVCLSQRNREMNIRRAIALAVGLAVLAVTSSSAQTLAGQAGKTTEPTLVKDAENPARSAVYGACGVEWTNSTGFEACDLLTVPAGKRLIVEHAAVLCLTGGTDSIAFASIQATLAPLSQTFTNLVLVRQSAPSGSNRWAASQSLRVYSDPESIVRGWAWFDGDPADSAQVCQFSMSGHLVDLK